MMLTPEQLARYQASCARRRSPSFGESFGSLNVKPLELSDAMRELAGAGISEPLVFVERLSMTGVVA